MNTAYGVIKPDYVCTTTNMRATRVCAVCSANEFKDAVLCYSEDKFWLCPECLKRLKKLLDKSTES